MSGLYQDIRPILVIIPTYRRHLYIKDILQNQVKICSGSLFRICIYDSSDDDNTENEFKEYIKQGGDDGLVTYVRLLSNISLPSKVRLAIETCLSPYFYIVGDSIVLHYRELEEELLKINYSKYDVININSNSGYFCKKNGCANYIKEYGNQSREFITDNMSLMTLYGATIVKTELFMEAIDKRYFERFFNVNNKQFGFVYISTLCENILDHKDLQLISFFSDSIRGNNIEESKREKWNVGESFYAIGLVKFINSIESMKNLEQEEKRYIYKRYYKNDWSTYKVQNIITLKMDSTLSKQNIKKYREQLEKAGLYQRFVFVNMIPRWLCRGLVTTVFMAKPFMKKIIKCIGKRK